MLLATYPIASDTNQEREGDQAGEIPRALNP
jgi:hypothetical protein